MNRWCLIFLAVWALLEFTACSKEKLTLSCYELPDGSLCHRHDQSGAGMIFMWCDNGREYLNPAWSKWHNKCPKEF